METQQKGNKPGSGYVGRSEDKTLDWHADFRGSVMLPDGSTEFWLDLTSCVDKNGKDGFKVKLRPRQPKKSNELNDDPPF